MVSTVSCTCWPFECLLWKKSIRAFAHFKIRLFIFFAIELYDPSKYILILDMWFANIFCHSIGCLLILFNQLCLGSPFLRLQVCSSSYFWCLPPVSDVGSVACVGFLVGGD